MTDARCIATVSGYDEMIEALRARKGELAISDTTFESLTLWPAGYTGKVFGDVQSRRLGAVTMWEALAALGLGVQLVEVMTAEELAVRFGDKYEPRNGSQVRDAQRSASLGKRAMNRAFPHVLRELARRGVIARLSKLTPAARRRIAKNAARARWDQKKPQRHA